MKKVYVLLSVLVIVLCSGCERAEKIKAETAKTVKICFDSGGMPVSDSYGFYNCIYPPKKCDYKGE